MHSRSLTTVAAAALVAALAALPLGTGGDARAKQADQQYCRPAAALPLLGKEQDGVWRDRRRPGGDDPRSAVERLGGTIPPPPAPPPPPPVMPSAERPSEKIAVTGARRPAGDAAPSGALPAHRAEPPAAMGAARRGSPPRAPQSGILTAGEHDDLLNPELYAAYVDRSDLGQHVRGLPRLDTMRVVTVKVEDRAGQPIAFADVKVRCSDGNSITLATQADGSAVFFPGLDRLSPRVDITASQAGRPIAAARPLLISNAPGGQTIGITANAPSARVAKLDMMLVIDTTGSMSDEIAYLQAELRSIIASIAARHPQLDIRVGFVFYRDIGDEYVTRTIAFGRDIGRAQHVLAQQHASGGGDYPEAMDEALIRAVSEDWRDDAVKSLLLVADAPPHDGKFARSWAAAEVARAKRIHITPVAASGVADKAEYAMRAMAAATQSRYLFLTDDSGVGNEHAPPAVDCYLVTRLDALVRRVIDSQISGRRIEPETDEVIRSVGDYDQGKCRLPASFRWQKG